MKEASPQLVLGVISAPASEEVRQLARLTWLHGAHASVLSRFVIGANTSLCHPRHASAVIVEEARQRDIVRVESPDCHKGFSAEKVHAWYSLALKAWPSAEWLGKVEEDSLVRVGPLSRLVAALPSSVEYAGFMQWQVSDLFQLVPCAHRSPALPPNLSCSLLPLPSFPLNPLPPLPFPPTPPVLRVPRAEHAAPY